MGVVRVKCERKGRNALGVVKVKCENQGKEFSESCRGKVWESRGEIQRALWR